jgi:hypothetical protein
MREEMNVLTILVEQLADPFRVGLLIALLFTAANSSGIFNRWLPIALGLVFVAVLIPTAMASDEAAPVTAQIGVGLLSNGIIVGIMLLAEAAFNRIKR